MSLDPLSNVASALERAKIIPDVIPSTASFASPGAPTLLFSVVYPTSTGKEVLLGNEFTTEETQEEPVVSFAPMTMSVGLAENEGSEEVGYTLCMLDPDVPTAANPEFRSFRHWVVRAGVLNAQACSRDAVLQITGLKSPTDSASATSSAAALKTQAAVTPYRPPGPRPNSGTHRYSTSV